MPRSATWWTHIQKVWSRSEEAQLVAMKQKAIPLKDTALGIAANQMACAVVNDVDNLDKESMQALRQAIDRAAEESKDNN